MIKNHLEKYQFSDEELVKGLNEDFYVDGLVSDCDVANAKIFVEKCHRLSLRPDLNCENG